MQTDWLTYSPSYPKSRDAFASKITYLLKKAFSETPCSSNCKILNGEKRSEHPYTPYFQDPGAAAGFRLTSLSLKIEKKSYN